MKINRTKINYWTDWVNFYVFRKYRNLSNQQKTFLYNSLTSIERKNHKHYSLIWKIINT